MRFVALTFVVAVSPAALTAQRITVGPNVQISAPRPRDAHSEPVIATDPKNANRIIAASHISWHDTVGTKSIAYVSFDAGKTWSISLERRDSTITADAAVAYGPDGSAYFATLARWGVFRSRDGGRTWDPPSKTPPAYGWDREYLVADFSGGKYHGRVYMNATVNVPWVSDSSPPGFGGTQKEHAIALYTSLDGTNFQNPILRLAPRPEGILGMSDCVVLTDGQLTCLYGHRKPPLPNAAGGGGRGGLAARTPLPAANYWLDVISSTDGGETWNTATHVGDYWMNRPRSEGAVIPDLAADPGSPLFKDRLYVVWSDFRSGRLEVMYSYSSDKGRTWSTGKVVSDDKPFANPLVNGPDNMTPTVAVNNDGVVCVNWYDQRESLETAGWNIRIRCSLDGGDTWTPGVKVNDKPTVFGGDVVWNAPGRSGGGVGGGGGRGGRGGGGAADTSSARSGGNVVSLSAGLSYANFAFSPGHNGAFAADAAGAFHPAWIDYRTGMAQLWTAAIRVDGKVARNGGGDLADLADLSNRVNLVILGTSYDRATNRLTFRTRLRNTSRTDTLRAPLKARVLTLTSEVANSVEIANPDNQVRGVGAVFDFSPLLRNGVLLPDSLSATKDLVFQLTGLGSFRENLDLRLGFVNMEARILGPAVSRRR